MANKKRGVKSVIIPEELIIKIISRVPVKDLMRFTCVSKAWYSLIHIDPYFYSLQIECTALDRRQFLLIEKLFGTAYPTLSYHYHLIDLDWIEDESINLREIPNPFQDTDARVLDSCQGLLVLQQLSTLKMAVSNPTTRKHLILPANPDGDAEVAFCGFGYDRAHHCYKLIFCGFGYDRAHHCYKLIFETKQALPLDRSFDLMVYDINNDMWCRYEWKDWRQHSDLQCWSMICVDGVQYWCLHHNLRLEREIIKVICFVLATGEFHEVETPDFGEVKYYPNMYVLDGRLCLIVIGLENNIREVWMIDIECDSNSSKAYSWRWEKILSLSNPRAMLPQPHDVGEHFLMIPLCFSACKTRILFDVGQTLFWYDQVKHQFCKLNDDPVNRVYCIVMSYTPSLVGSEIF